MQQAELDFHAARSLEELRMAVSFAQRTFGLSDSHRGGFFDYYASRFQQQSQLFMVAEADNEIHGVVLASIQSDHILIGEVAIDAAYQRQGIGSRLLALAEEHARQMGYQRFLLGAGPEVYGFYLKNGYAPLLWLSVENQGMSQLEQLLQNELHEYPIVWGPDSWRQGDQRGFRLSLKVPAPDEALLKRVEQAVPTCQVQYLFSKE